MSFLSALGLTSPKDSGADGYATGPLVPGREYNVRIVVAPLGVPGKQMVEDWSGTFVAEAGDTPESVQEHLRAHAVDSWHRENPGTPVDEFLVLSFDYDEA